MHYKKIYIRDFGIFNNQNLDDISNKLVVIGGKNRAGKSTFLKLLRYLPYGLPQDNSIPPAASNYYIEAELEKENTSYNLYLEGFSNPRVLDKKRREHSAVKLFNQLDQLTYQHLFSISLDELQHLSKISGSKKKEKRLYSILLGAGFSELVRVPELADKYYNRAVDTGGKRGDPSVAAFKPYYNQIREAEDDRDEALLEVKEFSNKREELLKKQSSLQKLSEKIESVENEYILIDLLKNNYSELQEIEAVEQKLKRAVSDISPTKSVESDNAETMTGIFNQRKKLNELINFFEQNKLINKFKQKEEALKERIKNYKLQKEKLAGARKQLLLELESLNSSWEGGLQQLNNIELDLIEEQKLNLKLKDYENLNSDLEKIKSEIKRLKNEKQELSLELEAVEFRKPETVLKQSYLILAVSFLTLGSSFLINLNQLRYLSLILALAAFFYYSSSYKTSQLEKEKADKLKKEKELKQREIAQLEQNLAKKTELLEQLKKELDSYAQILGVKEDEYRSFLASYYREIRDKRRRYQELKNEEKAHLANKEELLKTLQELKTIINNTALNSDLEFSATAKADLIKNYQNLFGDFELIKDLKALTEQYLTKKNQLKHTLKASEKIKTALTEINQEQSYYQIFINFYQQFPTAAAVETEKESFSLELSNLKTEKEKLEEKITTLKNRIDELSTSSRIEKAQQKIDLAQTKLEKKAQDYALNQSVAFILKKLRSRMIKKAEEELLKPASKIMKRISSGYYSHLKTASDLEERDFRIISSKNKEEKQTKELSQGSLEQLFLSVRLSRIKEITPPLPLVLDDSLVNFDRSHLYNTAELLAELAGRHQIFILSCHPHLISFINNLTNSAQYWKLDSGHFELSGAQELISHLSY